MIAQWTLNEALIVWGRKIFYLNRKSKPILEVMVRKYLLKRETQKEHDIVRKQSLDERFHNAGQNQQK